MAAELCPAVAGILAQPQITRRGSHRQSRAAAVDVQRVAVDEIVAFACRQPHAQNLEALAAVPCPGDDEPPVDRDAALVLDGRNEPSRARIARQIGRESCREGVCQYVWILVVAVSLKKKKQNRTKNKQN